MSSGAYVDTLLVEAVWKAGSTDGFQKFEERPSKYGYLDAAFKSRNILVPAKQLEAMRVATSRPVSIDVFKKEAAGAGTARKCAGTGKGSTERVPLTWQTFVEEFEISELEMAENNFTLQEMFNKRLNQKMINLAKRIESAGIAHLESNISVGEGNNFTTFNDAFQVPNSRWDLASNLAAFWVNSAKADFFKNDLDADNMHLIGDANMMANLNTLMNQGNSNSVNTFWQLSGMTSSFTNRIVNNEGIYATGYVFEMGAIGILTWINKLEREGADIGTDRWYSFVFPRYGFQVGIKYKGACADNSGTIDGAQADLSHAYVIAVDVCFLVQYSSDDNTGIYKYELDEDNNVLSGSGSYV